MDGCWEIMRAGGEGVTEDEMIGWHHRLNGHESEQTLGDGAAVHGVAKSGHDSATKQQQR